MSFSFINNILDRLSSNIAIDLGTANTPVYIKGKGIKICEPSYIAIDRKEKKILATGHGAKLMEGRVPGHIEIIRPVRSGVIDNFGATVELLHELMGRLQMRTAVIGSKVIIGITGKATPLEEKSVVEAATQAGARQVFTLKQNIAAAIGTEMPVMEPKGNMVIDIGAGNTQVSVISMGDNVVFENIDMAGDRLTEKIMTFMRSKYKLSIGNNTAEEVKIFLGSACPHPDEMSMKVKGSELTTGLPKTVKVEEGEIREFLSPSLNKIVDAVKRGLENTPPELMSDIQENGVILTGGGALLKGMDKLIEEKTGLTVKVPKDPLYTVALGLGALLNNHELFKQLTRENNRPRYQT